MVDPKYVPKPTGQQYIQPKPLDGLFAGVPVNATEIGFSDNGKPSGWKIQKQ